MDLVIRSASKGNTISRAVLLPKDQLYIFWDFYTNHPFQDQQQTVNKLQIVARNTWSIAPRGHSLVVTASLQAQNLETNQRMEDRFWENHSPASDWLFPVLECSGDCLVGIARESHYFKVNLSPLKNCFNGHRSTNVTVYLTDIQYTVVTWQSTL